MAMPAGGLVRITMNQTHVGQQVRNVFWYRNNDVAGSDATVGIGQTFWETVRAAWRTFLPNTPLLTFDSVDVRYMGGDLDYGTFVVPEAERQGTRAAGSTQLLPSFVAANITLNPINRQVRPGSKRIGGLIETDNNGNALEVNTRNILVQLGNAFVVALASGLFLDVLVPVIVGEATPTRPSRILVPVISAQVSRTLTTQNSRKVGRGI